jgi:hypothetical protein
LAIKGVVIEGDSGTRRSGSAATGIRHCTNGMLIS